MTLRHAHALGLFVAAVLGLALWPVDYRQNPPPGLRRDEPTSPRAQASSGPVIGPGHEAQVLALFDDVPRDGPWTLHAVRIDVDRVVAEFANEQGVVGARLVMRSHAMGSDGSPSFSFTRELERDDAALRAVLDAAERSVKARDRGGIFDRASVAAPAEATASRLPGFLPAALLVAWALVLLARDRFRPRLPPPLLVVRRTHLLPAALQVILFAYWGLYYPEVWHHLPVLGVLLCFAVAFDLLMAWTLRRPAHVGFAVVPVVLSANLFVWFDAASAWAYFAIVAVALASRAVRRGDAHIFNPSAVAVALYGVLALALPNAFPYVDIANAFNLPPNQAELIFLLALVPHLLLDTTVLSAMAALAMVLAHSALGHGVPSPTWPAWLLSITLLAGDPATMPKTAGGRALFGLFFGLGVGLTGFALTSLGQYDYFAKVLPLPAVNLLAPKLDAWAARLKLPAQTRRARLAVPAAWAVGFAVALSAGKAGGFEPHSQRDNQTRFLVLRDGAASCTDNPLFCRAFSFGAELACWRGAPSCPAPR